MFQKKPVTHLLLYSVYSNKCATIFLKQTLFFRFFFILGEGEYRKEVLVFIKKIQGLIAFKPSVKKVFSMPTFLEKKYMNAK